MQYFTISSLVSFKTFCRQVTLIYSNLNASFWNTILKDEILEYLKR